MHPLSLLLVASCLFGSAPSAPVSSEPLNLREDDLVPTHTQAFETPKQSTVIPSHIVSRTILNTCMLIGSAAHSSSPSPGQPYRVATGKKHPAWSQGAPSWFSSTAQTMPLQVEDGTTLNVSWLYNQPFDLDGWRYWISVFRMTGYMSVLARVPWVQSPQVHYGWWNRFLTKSPHTKKVQFAIQPQHLTSTLGVFMDDPYDKFYNLPYFQFRKNTTRCLEVVKGMKNLVSSPFEPNLGGAEVPTIYSVSSKSVVFSSDMAVARIEDSSFDPLQGSTGGFLSLEYIGFRLTPKGTAELKNIIAEFNYDCSSS